MNTAMPRGHGDDDLVYDPWPLFVWLRTPLYAKDHKSANQDDLFYCGRSIWPPDDWWQQHFETPYWVVRSKRKGNKCGECQTASNNHLARTRDDSRGYWENPTPVEEPESVISLDALARLVRDGLI